jgi:hypothetical protein
VTAKTQVSAAATFDLLTHKGMKSFVHALDDACCFLLVRLHPPTRSTLDGCEFFGLRKNAIGCEPLR